MLVLVGPGGEHTALGRRSSSEKPLMGMPVAVVGTQDMEGDSPSLLQLVHSPSIA